MSTQKIKNANNYNEGGSVVLATRTGLISKGSVQVAKAVDAPDQYIFGYDNPKYEDIIATSGAPTVVAAIPGHSIRLLSYTLSTGIAQSIKWQSNTTDLTGSMSLNANDNMIQSSDQGLMETQSGHALRLLPSGSGIVSGHITYVVR